MERQGAKQRGQGSSKARKTYEDAVLRAVGAFMETKKQADIEHEEALKQATDKQAKDQAEIKYKNTLEQARKVRDKITDGARKSLNGSKE